MEINKRIVVFCMPLQGHFQRVKVVIGELIRLGQDIYVFTDISFKNEVESLGAKFIDLNCDQVDTIDSHTFPKICRYVSFAGALIDKVMNAIEHISPSLIIYDSFAVIGYVAGRLSGLPYVCICSGGQLPDRKIVKCPFEGRSEIFSPACLSAVEKLQFMGIDEATPYLAMGGKSPYLNLFCETMSFLTNDKRRDFSPVEVIGCLDENMLINNAESSVKKFIYISFGTIVWRSYAEQALQAMKTLSEFFSGRAIDTIISIGGARLTEKEISSMRRPYVQVERYVDQHELLKETRLFVTHNGLNSTHEAICNKVPMISYPFFGDQPPRSQQCVKLGISIPLANPREKFQMEDVELAFSSYTSTEHTIRKNLIHECHVEKQTVANRAEILKKMLALSTV